MLPPAFSPPPGEWWVSLGKRLRVALLQPHLDQCCQFRSHSSKRMLCPWKRGRSEQEHKHLLVRKGASGLKRLCLEAGKGGPKAGVGGTQLKGAGGLSVVWFGGSRPLPSSAGETEPQGRQLGNRMQGRPWA